MIEYKLIEGVRHYRRSPTEPWRVDNLNTDPSPIPIPSPSPRPINNTSILNDLKPFVFLGILVFVLIFVFSNSFKNNDKRESNNITQVYEQLIMDADNRYLTKSELKDKDIQFIINGIYARHGRAFHAEENIQKLSAFSWYAPEEGKTDEEIVLEFNNYEKKNIQFLSYLVKKE